MIKYSEPEIKIMKFEQENIITTSGLIDGENGNFSGSGIIFPEPKESTYSVFR